MKSEAAFNNNVYKNKTTPNKKVYKKRDNS